MGERTRPRVSSFSPRPKTFEVRLRRSLNGFRRGRREQHAGRVRSPIHPYAKRGGPVLFERVRNVF